VLPSFATAGPEPFLSVAFDDRFAFAAKATAGGLASIVRVDLVSGAIVDAATAVTTEATTSIAVDETNIYWLEGAGTTMRLMRKAKPAN